jgi:hypothetical protein
MTQLVLLAIDLAAVAILTFALYFPRHRRRDLVVAFLVVNIGVLAVSEVLGSTAVSAGVGLGLFGVLSIIRLRSSEIAQHEVAYYFASLALGLFAGMSDTVDVTTVGLMVLLLLAVFIGDHPRLFSRYRQQTIVLDKAIVDEADLVAHLETMLGARVHGVVVERLDLVNDMTTVNVRFQLGAARSTAPSLESISPESNSPVESRS